MKRLFFLVGFILLFIVQGAEACVGRKLTIGYRDTTEQRIIAEVLAILIEERTGTKVTLKEFEDSLEAHRAIENNEIQLYIEYTGVGLTEILGEKPVKDPKQVYNTVKKAYMKNFDLIWLKTFGFVCTDEEHDHDLPLYAAPVVRKDTLNKFPALARLINKLSNRIDNQTIKSLIDQVEKEGKKPKDVASKFLAKLGISFTFTPGQA